MSNPHFGFLARIQCLKSVSTVINVLFPEPVWVTYVLFDMPCFFEAPVKESVYLVWDTRPAETELQISKEREAPFSSLSHFHGLRAPTPAGRVLAVVWCCQNCSLQCANRWGGSTSLCGMVVGMSMASVPQEVCRYGGMLGPCGRRRGFSSDPATNWAMR